MTTEELDILEPGTIIYLPSADIFLVTSWIIDRRVIGTNYYTLTHPPDADGVVSNKRPVYFHALDLIEAKLTEQDAWLWVINALDERIKWINKSKLSDSAV